MGRASYYAQLDLGKTSFDFGTNPVIDSMVLTLGYNEHYGDTNTSMTYRVFRLDDKLYADSTYYTFTTFNAATEIGNVTVSLNPKDSISEHNVKLGAHIRIPINPAVVAEFAAKLNTSEMKVNDEFINFFKGIYVTVDKPMGVNEGNYIITNYKANNTRLAMYYYNADADSLTFTFPANVRNRVAHFDHDYTGTQLGAQLIDSTLGGDYAYLNSLGSTELFLKFNDLKKIAEGRTLAVVKAKIILPSENVTNKSLAHKTIRVLIADSLGRGTSKYNITSPTYDSVKQEFSIDITFILQNIFNGKHTDFGFILKAPATYFTPFQTRFYRQTNPLRRARLQMQLVQY
ncbi:MAG: DUF4270 family protein [Bacteroidetes bacterium]|nr:DUF4270 family protein [Bacteroidota bacterium]